MQKKIFVLLYFIISFFIFSCHNFNSPTTNDLDSNESNTDDYAYLRETGDTPSRIVEDLSGKVIVLTENDFIERITAIDNPKGFQYLGQTPCIVELYAEWCKPCGYLSVVMNELAPEYKGKVIFYKINSEKARGVSAAFKVKNIPMLLYFKPRGEISTTIGYLNREELMNMIDELLLQP
ncbi:MAG: thioredoxin family protein [Bacteroidales bacterium]|jgi:thiol-disulfide isomerase/thioredoxin|nr:thioredoxin family protein [Bacteroidales bacterium]